MNTRQHVRRAFAICIYGPAILIERGIERPTWSIYAIDYNAAPTIAPETRHSLAEAQQCAEELSEHYGIRRIIEQTPPEPSPRIHIYDVAHTSSHQRFITVHADASTIHPFRHRRS